MFASELHELHEPATITALTLCLTAMPPHNVEPLEHRVVLALKAKGAAEIGIAEVQSWFPEYHPRQVTHAVNKLHTKGKIVRWDWPVRGNKQPRYITTPCLLDESLSVMKVELTGPTAGLYAAFGVATNHKVRVEPVREEDWTLRRKPGVVAYRGVNLLR